MIVQHSVVFALRLIPVAISALAALVYVSEFIYSFVEPNFSNVNYDYIIGKINIFKQRS